MKIHQYQGIFRWDMIDKTEVCYCEPVTFVHFARSRGSASTHTAVTISRSIPIQPSSTTQKVLARMDQYRDSENKYLRRSWKSYPPPSYIQEEFARPTPERAPLSSCWSHPSNQHHFLLLLLPFLPHAPPWILD